MQVRKIKIKKGVFTVVSVEDYDWLVDLGPWRISDGYVTCWKGKRMHRLILERHMRDSIPSGMVADHKDRNRLNNTISNIRLATFSQNARNRSRLSSNSTGYIGVDLLKRNGLYRARLLYSSGERKVIGTYRSAIDAAHAYDREALRDDPEFKCTNYSLGLVPKDDGRELLCAHPRWHPKESRHQAIQLLENGARLHEVSKTLGIPKTTIYRWSQENGRESS